MGLANPITEVIMRHLLVLPALAAALAAGPQLQAQDPHMGFAVNLVFPTGEFNNKTYPPTQSVTSPQNEGYDVGVGGHFTLSFPVDPHLALRLNLGYQVCNGSNTASGYSKIDLQHQMFSIGGEMQFFVDSAYRHRGTYFIAGLSADFERFERTYSTGDWHDYHDDGYYDDNTDTTRKSRMGAVAGIGHSFGYSQGGRFTLEATFHKTISGNDVDKSEPPSTDFVKVSFGWVF